MRLLFAALAVLAVVRIDAAPTTNATCVAQQWSINSIQQSPCLVSAFLSAQCTTDNDWIVYGITQGPYASPSGSNANMCLCNSVQWNLLSACSMCQGGSTSTWSEWIANCPSYVTNVAAYPMPLPQNVVVPHWAYYDFTLSGVFNAVIAQQQTGAESSAPAATTAVPTSTSGSPTGGSSRPTTSPRSSSNNTGAIVGGVVGGVLGLALLAIIAFLVIRKSKNDPPSKEHYAPSAVLSGTTMGEYRPGMPQPGTPSSGSKLYNPNDPATFPGVHPSPLPYSPSFHPSHNTYGGAPEV